MRLFLLPFARISNKIDIGYFIVNTWVVVNYVEMFSGILALSTIGDSDTFYA